MGEAGEDTILKVPKGISILNDQGKVLMDFNKDGQKYIAAAGGTGGCPETGFIGLHGQHTHIRLDLKVLADLGLVGFPNAGKSTLLDAISRARPKIASYPFTTLKPNLGHLQYPDNRVITMADLPGLIEGAHYNVGMGHKFLKHVERTKLLLFVVDVHGFQLNPENPLRTAFETTVLLNRELELYNPDLLRKPCLLLVNKMDLPESGSKWKDFNNFLTKNYDQGLENIREDMIPKEKIEFREVITMSAGHDPKSVGKVKEQIRLHLDQIQDEISGHEDKVRQLSIELEQASAPQGPVIN
jgi:Obg family GTPase CgtA